MRRAALIAAVLTAALAAGGPGAQASVVQESTFQDDNHLVYDTPENVADTLDRLATLGVDRVRVSVFWKVVAPARSSRERPQFDAADPAAYPRHAWDRYDVLLRLARARGIAVNFNLTGPAPLWATGTPEREDIAETFEPSAKEFDLFVRAVGTRYSGAYSPPGEPAGRVLPRVDYWSIWNEPNQSGWLTPQWVAGPGGQVEASPRLYRDLADAAYDGLDSSGHKGDTILVGETAPKGLNVTGTTRSIKPGRFIRRLYCLDDQMAALQGDVAKALGCPSGDDARKRFAAAHPVLFKATGWSHHPYELTFAPVVRPADPDFFTVANLDALQGLLRAVFTAYQQPLPGGALMPLYLTEFGYQTNPPDPVGVTLNNQARYLNASEYLTARDPAVRTLSQFLLVDDKPLPGFPRTSPGAWGGTFQTGLVTLENTRKPAYSSYRLPIHLPRRLITRGKKLRVWGLVRPAPEGRPIKVDIEVRTRRHNSKWRRKKRITVANARHYVDTKVRIRGAGAVRIVWVTPQGETLTSRAAWFKLRPKRRR